jgi:four helix bundle protein
LKKEEGFVSVKYFEDLEVWKTARCLTDKIYELTATGSFAKDYGLRDQIRRAAVSIMSNIAEGYERGGNQEFIQFLSIAKGSCGEVRCQLYVAMDQKYIEKLECEQLIDSFKKLSIMINNFIEYLKGSPLKGYKYKKPVRKSMKEEMDEMMKELSIKKTV